MEGKANAPPFKPVQSKYFRAVVQAHISGQMDVLRWLQTDDCYEIVYILHDKDRKQEIVYTDSAETVGQDGEEGTADELEEIAEGDIILPHYHILLRTPKKCLASTLKKRFGGYVHFQVCFDPCDYAHYLTHDCFRARHKHKYSKDDLQGDLSFYREMLGDNGSAISAEICYRWQGYLKQVKAESDLLGNFPQKAIAAAFRAALDAGDKQVIKSAMAHAFFFKSFFD